MPISSSSGCEPSGDAEVPIPTKYKWVAATSSFERRTEMLITFLSLFVYLVSAADVFTERFLLDCMGEKAGSYFFDVLPDSSLNVYPREVRPFEKDGADALLYLCWESIHNNKIGVSIGGHPDFELESTSPSDLDSEGYDSRSWDLLMFPTDTPQSTAGGRRASEGRGVLERAFWALSGFLDWK
ncbi:hypothetical protein CXQ85_004529 [Candidozyma haemuli]|uniref:Uncharacterized protein n=1 Tax=Candidozyma haemuli TaxID=45357 RepID=A0A2V1AVV8_9ASCO|nr:hypothetical protein CXQ85_004529 [[Candida] haemuloni]PVH21011.1 hypothetical protein CXQ85_004529 [[Candida] haemuloni]